MTSHSLSNLACPKAIREEMGLTATTESGKMTKYQTGEVIATLHRSSYHTCNSEVTFNALRVVLCIHLRSSEGWCSVEGAEFENVTYRV